MSFKASVVLTKDLPPEVEEAVKKMIGQIPIVWCLREGGKLRIPIKEVDATGPYILNCEVQGSDFVFHLTKKD